MSPHLDAPGPVSVLPKGASARGRPSGSASVWAKLVRACRARILRWTAWLVWRGDRRIARKLAEFSATETGSGLDMLRASELAGDPRLRRIFLRHALDEARHARMFRRASMNLDHAAVECLSEHATSHAHLQDLYARKGEVAFLAFVRRAERRGEAHFRALAAHLADSRPELASLFLESAKEERFHAGYSEHWLGKRAGAAQAGHVFREAREAAWATWRRSGQAIGGRLAWLVCSSFYFTVLPAFAVVARVCDPERPGWKGPRTLPESVEAARRQF